MPYQLLDEIMSAIGEPGASQEVQFLGRDPVFPTSFRFGEAGAALIAASGVMARRIWEIRTGRRQTVTVDVEAAAAAMRSALYLRIEPLADGNQLEVRWNQRGNVGLGAFETADGRLIYLQRQFEYHRARQESVLNCEDERESIARAISQWNAFELEEAIARAGASAGVVRTTDEWTEHAQGRAVATLPLVEIEKLDDSLPIDFPVVASRPLSGVRVLDLTRVLAGPTAGRTLAEHGADVLRVGSSKLLDDRTQAVDTGHGKRAADVDLDTAAGVAQLHELVQEADVFSQSFRPDSLASRGFGPAEVSKLRPGIIYLTLSAFGHDGPWSSRRGFDSIVQNVSGIALENGSEGRPRATPNPLDYGTGYLAAAAVMAALTRRAREGGSYLVRVSLAQTGRWIQGTPRVQQSLVESRPSELPDDRLTPLLASYEGPLGNVAHLAPIAKLSETPGEWILPAVPLGFDQPEWLPRD